MNKKETYKLIWDFIAITDDNIFNFIDWLYGEGFEIVKRKESINDLTRTSH